MNLNSVPMGSTFVFNVSRFQVIFKWILTLFQLVVDGFKFVFNWT